MNTQSDWSNVNTDFEVEEVKLKGKDAVTYAKKLAQDLPDLEVDCVLVTLF